MLQGLMKRIAFLGAAVALVLASPGYSALRGTPFIPEYDQRFSDIEAGNFDAGAISSADIADGTITAADVATDTGASSAWVVKRVNAIYDYSVNGGAQAAHLLGLTLPAGAIVVRSYLYVNTQLIGGSATIAFHCETANNLYTATNITWAPAGTLLEGQSTGASTAFKAITAACPITATIGSSAVTQGKITLYIEYVVHN